MLSISELQHRVLKPHSGRLLDAIRLCRGHRPAPPCFLGLPHAIFSVLFLSYFSKTEDGRPGGAPESRGNLRFGFTSCISDKFLVLQLLPKHPSRSWLLAPQGSLLPGGPCWPQPMRPPLLLSWHLLVGPFLQPCADRVSCSPGRCPHSRPQGPAHTSTWVALREGLTED